MFKYYLHPIPDLERNAVIKLFFVTYGHIVDKVTHADKENSLNRFNGISYKLSLPNVTCLQATQAKIWSFWCIQL